MIKQHPISRLLALAAMTMLWLTACAEERAPIDRVQPQALPKKFFIGEDFKSTADDPEFWHQGTLVDVGYGAAQSGLFTSTYAQPMSRMRWQITEDLLIGRLSYERIEMTDGKGAGGPTENGVIVVAYRIEKHFDIMNQYNPTTGEQLNVIVENSMDRPWYEREYIRVDFSKSLNVDSYDFDTLSLLGIYGSIKYESLAYYVEDPNDEEAPFFDFSQGYFDVTNKAFAKPGQIDLRSFGWGIDAFPACFLDNDFMGGSAPHGSCSPIEITVRHAFRRVTDSDYAPRHWDGFRFQSYGAFTVERKGYARNYGMSDKMWHRFITAYQIWERSHYYDDPETMTGPVECFTPTTTPSGQDPNRDLNEDGTADECAKVTELTGKGGSQCDPFKQRCTLPFQARTSTPLAWYYTNGSNLSFFEATDDATHEWDVAIRLAVATAKYAECQATGGANCATEYPVYFGQQDDNTDAVMLAREVDDCRAGRAYADKNQDEAACTQLADTIGSARGLDPGVIAIAKMPEQIVLCHSPVEANDPPACGDARLPEGITAFDCANARYAGHTPDNEELLATCSAAINVRRGDLRYHQVNVITEPQVPSPWGIYTDAEDPLTGEAISASINVWSHVNDLWSQKIIDVLRYIHGELSTADVTEGTNVRNYAAALEASNGGTSLPRLTKEEVNRRLKAFSAESIGLKETPHAHAHAHEHASNPAVLPKDAMTKARALKKELTGVALAHDAPNSMGAIHSARRTQIAGSPVEAELMTKSMQQYYGVDGLPMTPDLMEMVSPLRGGDPMLRRNLANFKEMALARQGTCMLKEAEAPIGLASLAKVLQAKFGDFNPAESPSVQVERAERMRSYLARKAHYAVIVHEMGHSIGMRHNFVSSSDAWGYRPQYWQLRTRNGQVSKECTDLQADGASCVGPRYFDPVTQEEKDNLIWLFMHSSVMDYAGEATQDTLGLGAYDFAAAKMFYGDTVAVFSDPSYAPNTPRGTGMLAKMDNFGGILGMQPQHGSDEIHYSQLQKNYDLISNCSTVDVQKFKPARWDEATEGKWHPVLDGLIVQVNGQYTRCKQPKVDYVPWRTLRKPTGQESAGFYRGGAAIDRKSRIRVPYGFATDRWADTGNLSVYRHDSGADAYELFDFFITQQEVGHIFNNYRRERSGFSVRSASNRELYRYNTKMRDGAKGLGLLRNIYKDFALTLDYNFDQFWGALAPTTFKDNILAAGIAFDHFARMASRPQEGAHFVGSGGVLRSAQDYVGDPGQTAVTIPNGATGYYGNIAYGGRPVENRLSEQYGDYDSDYTVNAGSYYGKVFSAMLFTESADNFISDSRSDFVDARYRAVSLADLFPDGFRRWLANMLTGDDFIKGARIRANGGGSPATDAEGYPSDAIGWTSWWGDTPRTCFPADGIIACSLFGDGAEADIFPNQPNFNTAVLDPQVGWEQQKFFIAFTLMFLPENNKQTWLDMLRMWELGVDADPEFENQIVFHNPEGKVYVAKTFGRETIFGKNVQRGIAARVLEYANELLLAGYVVDDGPDNDGDGKPDWYIPVISPDTGKPIVKYDPSVTAIDASGFLQPNGVPGCNAQDSTNCTCTANRACLALQDYVQVPFYLRAAMERYGFLYGLSNPGLKGVY